MGNFAIFVSLIQMINSMYMDMICIQEVAANQLTGLASIFVPDSGLGLVRRARRLLACSISHSMVIQQVAGWLDWLIIQDAKETCGFLEAGRS